MDDPNTYLKRNCNSSTFYLCLLLVIINNVESDDLLIHNDSQGGKRLLTLMIFLNVSSVKKLSLCGEEAKTSVTVLTLCTISRERSIQASVNNVNSRSRKTIVCSNQIDWLVSFESNNHAETCSDQTIFFAVWVSLNVLMGIKYFFVIEFMIILVVYVSNGQNNCYDCAQWVSPGQLRVEFNAWKTSSMGTQWARLDCYVKNHCDN